MIKVRCPQCNQETTWQENAYRPFCSEFCKMRDLGNWATEKYKIPEVEGPEGELEEQEEKTEE